MGVHLDETHVGRLSAELTEDTPAARVAVGSLIGTGEFRPPGMPARAILIISRVRGPLPIPIDTSDLSVERSWEIGLRDRVDGLYREAARPGDGPVPPDATAVVFDDEAEMLACLTSDLAEQAAADRWWWDLVLPGDRRAATVGATLVEHPEAAPAAIRLLSDSGRAVRVVEAMTAAECDSVLRIVAERHGAPDLLDASPGGDAPIDSAHPNGALPWEPWVPATATPAVLAVSRLRLLGVMLLLAERPGEVGSESFRAALDRLSVESLAEAPGTSARRVHTEAVGPFSPTGQSAVARSDSAAPDQRRPSDSSPRRISDHRSAAANEIFVGVWSAEPTPDVSATFTDPSDASPPTTATPAIDSESHESAMAPTLMRQPQNSIASTTHSEPTIASEPPRRFESVRPEPTGGALTSYGGVLYLVNLMTFLGLPSCFEEAWQLASRVGAWGTLETIARGLLPASTEVLADPVWRVLAQLDGREPGQVPHLDVAPENTFQLPWPIVDAQAGAAHWATDHGTLIVWAHGVIVAAVPRSDRRPSRQAAALLDQAGLNESELRRASASAAPLQQIPSRHGIGGTLERWSNLAIPFIQWRLAQALGTSRRDIETTLLRFPATIQWTRTHIDVTLALDSSSLPIRLAGLDRSPGWVPALGRVVTFNFVDGTSPW